MKKGDNFRHLLSWNWWRRDSVFSTTIEIFSIIALRLYLSLYHTAKATENTNRKQSLHYLCKGSVLCGRSLPSGAAL